MIDEAHRVAIAGGHVARAELLGHAEEERRPTAAPTKLPSPPRMTTQKAFCAARSPIEG